MATTKKTTTPKDKAAIGEGQYFFRDQILLSITEEVIFKPEDTHNDEVWKQFRGIVPKSRPDEHTVIMSPRTERVKKDLDMAQPGLYFVDFTRYNQFVHIREVLLTGSSNQSRGDRLGTQWTFIKAKTEKLASEFIEHCIKELPMLIKPKTVGIYFDIFPMFTYSRITRWTIWQEKREEWNYFLNHDMPVKDYWYVDSKEIAGPPVELLKEAIVKIDEYLEGAIHGKSLADEELDKLDNKIGISLTHKLREVPLELV